jgi:hypothetical protein
MSAAQEDRPTAFTYAGALLRVAYTTMAYWLVGLTPEENHWRKANAWALINAYRFAAWHCRKYLNYSEDSRARASLAWCYANLGMVESAAEHYRLAYARNKNPEIALYLALSRYHKENPSAVEISVSAPVVNRSGRRQTIVNIGKGRERFLAEFVTTRRYVLYQRLRSSQVTKIEFNLPWLLSLCDRWRHGSQEKKACCLASSRQP